MIKISKQETDKRWSELSPSLREALFSEESSNLVFQIAGARKLNEYQKNWLLVTAGDVLMGFIPLDNVKIAEELAERTGMDKQISYEITQEISRKIFEPLRADIEMIGKGASVIYSKEQQINPASRTTNEFRQSDKGQPTSAGLGEAPINRGQAIQNLENRLSGYNQESRPREFLNELTNDRNQRRGEIINDKFQNTNSSGENFGNNKNAEEMPDTPFIMHEEKPLFIKEQLNVKREPTSSPMSYQPFKLQDVKSQKEAPISAKIDLGQEENKDGDDNIRVVHYSEFKSIPKK